MFLSARSILIASILLPRCKAAIAAVESGAAFVFRSWTLIVFTPRCVPSSERTAVESRTLAQKHVSRSFSRNALRTFIAQSVQIDAGEQTLSLTEQYGPHGEMQFVDQTGLQILSNRRYTAAQPNVAAGRCSLRLVQSGVNAFGDE